MTAIEQARRHRRDARSAGIPRVRRNRRSNRFSKHKHDHEDECFIVLDGELVIDIEDKPSVTLGRHLGYTIPRGVVHRTRAAVKTVILMVEGAGVTPTGD